jgi:general secretion pathway protein G
MENIVGFTFTPSPSRGARSLRRRRNQRGMTLVEIIVVVAIIAMMSAGVALVVIPKFDEAKISQAQTDIANLMNALKMYYVKKGNFPDTQTGLKALVDTNNLDKMPKDPWDRDYVYINEGGKPVIVSYGRDGSPGGEGTDGDISSNQTGKKQ